MVLFYYLVWLILHTATTMNHSPFVTAAGVFCTPTLLHSYILFCALMEILLAWPDAVQLYHKILQGNNSFAYYLLPLYTPTVPADSCSCSTAWSWLSCDIHFNQVILRLSVACPPHRRPPTPTRQAPASLDTLVPIKVSEVSLLIQLSQPTIMLIFHQQQHVARWM